MFKIYPFEDHISCQKVHGDLGGDLWAFDGKCLNGKTGNTFISRESSEVKVAFKVSYFSHGKSFYSLASNTINLSSRII